MPTNKKTVHQAIDDRLSGLEFTPEMREAIKHNTAKPAKRTSARRPLALAAAAAGFVLVIGVSAVSGLLPAFSHLGNDTRPIYHPVNLATVDNGIRMDVLAAVNDGPASVVYLTLTDEESNRVTAETELYHVSFNGIFFDYGKAHYYDETSKTAYYRLESTEAAAGNAQASLNVQAILTGCREETNLDTGLTLADISTDHPALATGQSESGGLRAASFAITQGQGGASAELETAYRNGTLPLLEAGQALRTNPLPGIEVVAAGVVEGYLHLQYQPVTEAARYGQAEFILNWPGKSQQLAVGTAALGDKVQTGGQLTHARYEQIFELPKGVAAEEIHVELRGLTCTGVEPGSWGANFALENSPPMLDASLDSELAANAISRITVSPVGVTTYFSGSSAPTDALAIEVELDDETKMSGSSYLLTGADGSQCLRTLFAQPIDPSYIRKLLVNGKEVPLTAQP